MPFHSFNNKLTNLQEFRNLKKIRFSGVLSAFDPYWEKIYTTVFSIN